MQCITMKYKAVANMVEIENIELPRLLYVDTTSIKFA